MLLNDKPVYKHLSVRARVLHSHLSLTLPNLYRGKVEDMKCRKLLHDAKQMEGEQTGRDKEGEEETGGMVICEGERGEESWTGVEIYLALSN